MSWHTYHIFPIDFGWDFLPDLSHVISQAAAQDANDCIRYGDTAYKILRDFKFAMAAAEGKGWEGDFRDGPKVFFLPNDTEFQWGFVWKQDNNGETFIASPQPMPWLRPVMV
jgi:hypothetical protein